MRYRWRVNEPVLIGLAASWFVGWFIYGLVRWPHNGTPAWYFGVWLGPYVIPLVLVLLGLDWRYRAAIVRECWLVRLEREEREDP